MADSDDDLSRTATELPRAKPVASDDASAATMPATPEAKRDSASKVLPATIGKYRIERELGEGGMGVVYVAFDPDLERRVALKVLRAATSSEAAQRLQREARAMARLKHANVVTVHEVASAAGRDYVAMELVEGTSLAEWLRETKRSQTDILDAFVQAGRGLAAAHAAGIVHRDFKPHNVLRDRAGAVSVTDFGLAREAAENGDPLAQTMPLAADASASGSAKSSSLAGLTVTGALLGTPAYMAPEQWTGGRVTPATDQFAYCVALWEALTGARPFTGPTVDMLRAQILEGSAELDGSVLPKELRAPLMRGLDADPKKRWPSMDVLLAAIAPRTKPTRWIAIAAIGATAAVAITGAVLSLTGGNDAAPAAAPCRAPAMTLETVWSATKREALVHKKSTLAVAQLDADAKAWTDARVKACSATADVRPSMLNCLDGVLGRFDAAASAVAASTSTAALDAGAVLVDPAVCTSARPPRITTPSPELRDALAMDMEWESRVRDTSAEQLAALVKKTTNDPCASMYAHALRAWNEEDAAKRRVEEDLSEQGAERCEDDRVRADGALAMLALELGNQLAAGPVIEKRMRQAQIAAEVVMQSDIRAQLDDAHSDIVSRANDLDHAIEASDVAMTGYAARSRIYAEVDSGLGSIAYRQLRANPQDLAAVRLRFDALRKRASDLLGADSRSVLRIDRHAAYWLFSENDVAGSHAKLEALRKEMPIASPLSVHGVVVDEHGKPVSGATVVGGADFVGDEISIAYPDPQHSPYMRWVTTAADGSFTLETFPEGMVVAQKADLRSLAVHAGSTVRLTLQPTSRVEGKVELNGMSSVRTLVAFLPEAQDKMVRYTTLASVAPDGTFHCNGVLRGKLGVGLVITGLLGQTLASVPVDVNKPVVSNIVLTAPSKRTVYIVLRSAVGEPLANGQVLLQTGTVTATNLSELTNRVGSNSLRIARPITHDAPAEVKAVARDGDLYVAIDGAPLEAATACALPLPADISNVQKLQRAVATQMKKVPAVCKPVPPDGKVLVEDVPPWPRLD